MLLGHKSGLGLIYSIRGFSLSAPYNIDLTAAQNRKILSTRAKCINLKLSYKRYSPFGFDNLFYNQ